MAKKLQPPTPICWKVYKIAAKAVRLGAVEAPDEATAIEKAAAEFKVPATRLMAIRRCRTGEITVPHATAVARKLSLRLPMSACPAATPAAAGSE
jgi:hypothetical protein